MTPTPINYKPLFLFLLWYGLVPGLDRFVYPMPDSAYLVWVAGLPLMIAYNFYAYRHNLFRRRRNGNT